MTKTGKIIILIAVVLVVIGIVLTAIALMNGGTFMKTSAMEEKTYSFSLSDIKSLDVYTVADSVQILPAEGDEAVVKTMENEKHTYEVTLTDGTLKVTYKGNKNSFNFLNFGNWLEEEQTVTVWLPEKLAGSVKLSTVSGELEMKNLEAAGALRIDSTSGEISLSELRIGKDCTVSSVSGELALARLTVGSTLTVSATSGEIDMQEVTVGGALESKSVSGEISLDAVTAGGEVKCSSTSGEIDFNELKGKGFTFSSVSGEISGTIAEKGSEFTASAGTVSGDKNIIGDGTGERILKANTTSGDIQIEFIG